MNSVYCKRLLVRIFLLGSLYIIFTIIRGDQREVLLQIQRRSIFESDSVFFNYSRCSAVDKDPDFSRIEKFVFSRNIESAEPVDFYGGKSVEITKHTPFPNIADPAGINCSQILDNNRTEIKYARGKETLNPFHYTYRKIDFINKTRNCQTYLTERGFVTTPLNNEERGFPLAYSIVTYKEIELFERLLRAVYRPQNIYCVHVDAKSSEKFVETIDAIVKCFPNVFFTTIRLNLKWATNSIFLPDLMCMRELIKFKWKYFINLTGQEFPLRNNFELVSILKKWRGANDMESTVKRRFRPRLGHEYGMCGRKLPWRQNHVGKPPLGLVPVKGNMHGTFSRKFVEYVLNDARSLKVFSWVKKTNIAEETYFASLNSNPHLRAPGSYTGLNFERQHYLSREVVWRQDIFGKICHSIYRHTACINGYGDLYRLVHSPKFFTNKFIMDFEPGALTCLEKWFYERSEKDYRAGKVDTKPYEDLDFVKKALRT